MAIGESYSRILKTWPKMRTIAVFLNVAITLCLFLNLSIVAFLKRGYRLFFSRLDGKCLSTNASYLLHSIQAGIFSINKIISNFPKTSKPKDQ